MKHLLTLCLACLIVPPAQAARRVGEAEVRAGANGVPCFTISQREEERGGTPNFQSVTVTGGAGKPAMWRMDMPRERTFPVAYSMCIPYAGRVPALPQAPALPLESGKVYTVEIDTRPGKGGAMPLRYQARFCLARGPGGGTVVRHIGVNDRAGRFLYGCLASPD
ncbi:MAG: hypothetical protein JWP72_67 [Massilia sp.]|nr:hypothetical protein [Massilia sp.]